MYCAECGAESTQGLNYCKRCGTNLTAPTNQPRGTDSPQPPRVSGAGWAIAFATVLVTLGGLGIVFNSAFDLVRPLYDGTRPVAGAPTIAGLMVVFGSGTVLGVVAMLIQLFSRLLGVRPEPSAPTKRQRPFGDYKPAQLHPSPTGIPSVTEQTTRNFDPALYRDHES
jgi:hypothetical protein